MSEAPVLFGRVVTWGAGRRFGFIKADRVEYFVQLGDVADRQPLDVGQAVTFTPRRHERGPRATHVRRLGPHRCAKCERLFEGLSCPLCRWTLGT